MKRLCTRCQQEITDMKCARCNRKVEPKLVAGAAWVSFAEWEGPFQHWALCGPCRQDFDRWMQAGKRVAALA